MPWEFNPVIVGERLICAQDSGSIPTKFQLSLEEMLNVVSDPGAGGAPQRAGGGL
jgi:hypothetical protein